MRAFRLAYDGAPFRGFQRQPDVPTVEDALFDALRALDILGEDEPKPAGYSAAGRTDAGVSALAQTVAFEAPEWCTPSALNAELPGSVRAWASADVPADFHALRDARRREYVYHLHAPGVDDERVASAATALEGEHDFHNLTPDDDRTVRSLSVDLERDGEFLFVTVATGGFPRQLVRRLVSLLADAGSGERPPAAVGRVLGPEPLPGHRGIPPAPPHPLVLAHVEYDVAFEVDADGREAAASAFSARRVEHEERARAAGTILVGFRRPEEVSSSREDQNR